MDDFPPFSAGPAGDAQPFSPSGDSRGDVDDLKARVARLALICEALWEILKEKNALPPDLINLKVAELDLSDGRLNGRKANTLATCKKCNRVLQAGRQSCFYCGTFSDQSSVFNGFS